MNSRLKVQDSRKKIKGYRVGISNGADMEEKDIYTEEQMDFITEMMNIGAGNAAALSQPRIPYFEVPHAF